MYDVIDHKFYFFTFQHMVCTHIVSKLPLSVRIWIIWSASLDTMYMCHSETSLKLLENCGVQRAAINNPQVYSVTGTLNF